MIALNQSGGRPEAAPVRRGGCPPGRVPDLGGRRVPAASRLPPEERGKASFRIRTHRSPACDTATMYGTVFLS